MARKKVVAKPVAKPIIVEKPKEDPLLKIAEVMLLLNCCHSHVLNMINRRQIKAENIGLLGRKNWRIRRSDVDLFRQKASFW